MAAPETKESYVMVAAIDFGTTFSGYAFSFTGAETDIKINKNWGDTLGFQSYKTPTSVLLKGPQAEFEAFGYEAEEKYVENEDDNNGHTLKHLFRHFKMVLHTTEKLTTKTVVWSTDGRVTLAINVFTHALRFLKDHLLQQLSDELSSPPDPALIRWVITVPAVWSEESKQFMREAAFRSGCIKNRDSRQLVIALEPEAASFYCRQLDLVRFTSADDIAFPNGTKYMILDCGGGTNDMVVHEVVMDNKIKEVLAVSGGSHGGTCIEEKFIALLKQLLGQQFISSFKDKCPDQWFTLLSKFVSLKKKTKNDGKSRLSIDMSISMDEQYSTMYPGKRLKNAFADAEKQGIKFANGMLVMSNDVIQSLYNETVDDIVQGVKEIVLNPRVQPLKYIFMVGGFSESPFLQDAIKAQFRSNDCKVLVPNEAQLAIIKGAVLFGHQRDRISSRVARKTYGICVRAKYNPKIHDATKKFKDSDGKERVLEFETLVEIGDEIAVGSSKEVVVQCDAHSKKAALNVVFCSLPRKPKKPVEYFAANPDLKEMGKIKIRIPYDVIQMRRTYTVEMTFGNTEILAEVIDEISEDIVHTTLDFLSE